MILQSKISVKSCKSYNNDENEILDSNLSFSETLDKKSVVISCPLWLDDIILCKSSVKEIIETLNMFNKRLD